MNKYRYLLLLIFTLVTVNTSFGQSGLSVIKIRELLGNTAKAYLLSATRPGYIVDPYTNEANQFGMDISANISNSIFELPVYLTYGITDRIEIWSNFPVYTQSYNFNGNKIGGLGDVTMGIKYKFQQSALLTHSLQTGIKIPTANPNKDLGTGLVDFHSAIAQGIEFKNFSNSFYVELDYLKRRSAPQIDLKLPEKIKENIIDSLQRVFNYKYEAQLTLLLNPGYFIVKDKFEIYSGICFTRNYRLDFNTSSAFLGFDYIPGKHFSIDICSYYGIKNLDKFIFSGGITYSL